MRQRAQYVSGQSLYARLVDRNIAGIHPRPVRTLTWFAHDTAMIAVCYQPVDC